MSNHSTESSSGGREFRRRTHTRSPRSPARDGGRSNNSSTRGGGGVYGGRSQPRVVLRERSSQQQQQQQQQPQLLPSLHVVTTTSAPTNNKRISASPPPPHHFAATATTNYSTVPLIVNTTTLSRGSKHTTGSARANPEPLHYAVDPPAASPPSPKTTPVPTACPYLVHLMNACQEHLDSVHNHALSCETLPGSDKDVGDTDAHKDTTETCRLALDSLQRLMPAVEASLATTALSPPNDDIAILCDFYNNTMAGGFCPDAPNLWKDAQHGKLVVSND
jgi:hypothetical protein